MEGYSKIAFGGGCHWCTEAIFQSIEGVEKVEQGWIASDPPDQEYSEAVIVHFKAEVSLTKLMEVHLATHSSKVEHSKRLKYRSAIYYFDVKSKLTAANYLKSRSDEGFITKVLPFRSFKSNKETYQNYFLKNPEKPFCQRYIVPKLQKVQSLTE